MKSFGGPLGPRKQVDSVEAMNPQAKAAICREKISEVDKWTLCGCKGGN